MNEEFFNEIISDEPLEKPEEPKTKVINLVGGPGSGKSTVAAGLFYEMKKRGIKCEIVFEYSKEKVWEESFHTMDDEIYLFAKQNHRQWRLRGKVDYIITDHCLLNSIIYDVEKSKPFKNLILNEFNKFDNINFFIQREGEYETIGRVETEAQSKKLDAKIKKLFTDNELEYEEIASSTAVEAIIKKLGI